MHAAGSGSPLHTGVVVVVVVEVVSVVVLVVQMQDLHRTGHRACVSFPNILLLHTN